MATSGNTDNDLPFKAGADLSDGQFKAVTLSADDTIGYPTAVDHILGVLQNKPAAAGRGAEVRIAGKTKVKAGGTIAAGESLRVAASGWFTKCTSGGSPDALCIKGAASGYVGEAVIRPVAVFSTTSATVQQI